MSLRSMKITIVVLLLLAVSAAAPGVLRADPAGPQTQPRDVLTAAISVYATSEDAAALRFEEAAPEHTSDVVHRSAFSFSDDYAGGKLPGKQSWWPVLYSLIIPGTGELSMGYEKRGVALMVTEIVAWTGYFHNQSQGMDARDGYEAFADMNWTQQKWIDDHPEVYPALSGDTSLEELEEIGRNQSGSGSWPGYISWTGKEEDKQHYYENIGKYDWYISGWADFDPDVQLRDTALRDQYRVMREESNDQLDTANRFLYLSVAARVFSLVETTLLVRRDRKSYDEQFSRLDNHWRFQARPRGMSGAVVSLEYQFK
ncbi:MAG: hypothetical protein IH969_01210 [Candidatus Krumholzibacteriota bacterium]|nr:hypothetical protein [Candidatus Krumholzibacteriota bacterium]